VSVTKLTTSLDRADLETLRWATQHLEHPSLAARLSSMVGTPIEIVIKLMPRGLFQRTRRIADEAIFKAYRAAASSLRHDEEIVPRNNMYRAIAAGTGAVGGFFGLYALAIELPVSTTIMLRSIAEIARSQGEHIHEPETQMACLEVFALGGHSESDDAADTGYYGVRMALGWSVTNAARHLAAHGLESEGPALLRLVSAVGARFSGALTQKAAAQLVPAVGAASGAAINLIFMSHYQEMARGHFVVRRLERKYGVPVVQANYERFCRAR